MKDPFKGVRETEQVISARLALQLARKGDLEEYRRLQRIIVGHEISLEEIEKGLSYEDLYEIAHNILVKVSQEYLRRAREGDGDGDYHRLRFQIEVGRVTLDEIEKGLTKKDLTDIKRSIDIKFARKFLKNARQHGIRCDFESLALMINCHRVTLDEVEKGLTMEALEALSHELYVLHAQGLVRRIDRGVQASCISLAAMLDTGKVTLQEIGLTEATWQKRQDSFTTA